MSLGVVVTRHKYLRSVVAVHGVIERMVRDVSGKVGESDLTKNDDGVGRDAPAVGVIGSDRGAVDLGASTVSRTCSRAVPSAEEPSRSSSPRRHTILVDRIKKAAEHARPLSGSSRTVGCE
jgi:hypothetical protein